jgi:hypothetical protein
MKQIVETSHSATGAIESALKYVSPDAHWIARRMATAGGKTYKNAAPQRNRHIGLIEKFEVLVVLYYNNASGNFWGVRFIETLGSLD